MNRFVTRALIAGLVFGGTFGALRIGRAAADGVESTVLQADKSLLEALGKSDKTAVGKLLDANFAWTDTDGKTHTQAEVLGNLKAYAEDNLGDAEVKTHFYGEVETVAGEHHGARFLRVWVKRPAGWREFLELDTQTRPRCRARQAAGRRG